MSERRTLLLATALGVLGAIALAVGSRTEGYTRDEGYYFRAAELHWSFYESLGTNLAAGHPLRSFTRAEVDRTFGYNHEHPPLMKTLFGLSWRLFHKCDCPRQGGRHPIYHRFRHKTLRLLSESAALRLPAHLMGGLLVAFVFLFGARVFSLRAALVAAPLALAGPQMFFHAQLACFDAPIAVLWLLTIYGYWRSLTERRWAWRTGLLFGLALATKHNAYFLPLPMILHYCWVRRDSFKSLRFPPLPEVFLWMALLGPAVLLALWPWLWFDPVGRFREYFAFHLHHVYYNFEYLGTNYNKPPFPHSFPFVLTLLTAPVSMLALALAGAASFIAVPHLVARQKRIEEERIARRTPPPPPPPLRIWKSYPVGVAVRPGGDGTPDWRTPAAGMDTAPGLLMLLNLFFPMAVISFTGAPIFGGTKHFLAAWPFLALLAGAGLDLLVNLLLDSLQISPSDARPLVALAVALAVAPAIAETWRSHPYGLSHYNLIAGGPAGGADLGMNRQFWGYATRGILPWLNQHAPRNASVYWHDTNQDILNMDVREKLLRDDILDTGLEEPGVRQSSTAMVIHERHFSKYEYWIWDFYGTARPSLVLADEGVPLVTVYERPIH
jgi:hypothetical protein